MKTRIPLFATLLFAGALPAEDGKTFRYRTGAAGTAGATGVMQQSKQEIEDIGEINEQQGGGKWRVNVSGRGQYTSNAILSGSHGSGDFLFLPTVEVGYHTPLGKHFSFDLGTKIEAAILADHDRRCSR